MSESVLTKLGASIVSNDWPILVFAMLECFFLGYALMRAGKTSVRVKKEDAKASKWKKIVILGVKVNL